MASAEPVIDVRDCPECEDGTKGTYEGRVLIGGRGIYTCPVCGTKWQNADEKPASGCGSVRLSAPASTTKGGGDVG